MSLTEVHEDILNAPDDFTIVHQRNCLTYDAAGAAAAIFVRNPWTVTKIKCLFMLLNPSYIFYSFFLFFYFFIFFI